ncbi:flagellar basal body-associated FliL family protein [Catenuloplanes atrovinosus]|uniref:Flagellar protein FliL n=1 Tax=Catenuloplanes atrovinosus TaxID=137266 RepID=A0AAE3YWE9_9ACTN|nr:flagellar basal body-associated FliL family protein [Catenuloplanes atrovinosus]MDR7280477.1 flagellar FliL protein [Catenuloplanes atrovinosus]
MAKDDKAPEGDAPKKGGKKKLLIIIIAAVLLLGGGGGGAYMMLAGGSSEEETVAAPEPGAIVALDPITINLASGHYLKVGIALQATATAAEEPDGSKALNLAIDQYTNVEVAELETAEGRAKLKTELEEKVKKAYEEEVMAIYYTTFVTQ